ncbi:hypothetical protein ANCDUO_10128 [Ancylostoma duodenale]|uniref:Uncharacterized protein n=1 Tax=Ancylostoma duodenale TaxID=51022 RepID=A0A0C2GRM7_9BILA|nr:hypothetical protein ANCDUO_10128 [Ancylostoma duodenale]
MGKGLLHAEEELGIDEEFSIMAPSVILEKASQGYNFQFMNIMHVLGTTGYFTHISCRAFLIDASVIQCKRAADIWRSYFTQKLLHIVDETVAFYPPNAVEISRARDGYLEDFKNERKVLGMYLETGRIVEFLHKWECNQEEVSICMILLAEEFSRTGFWDNADAELVKDWIQDLQTIGYQFPARGNHTEYTVREDIRGANCRRANVQFEVKTADAMEKKSAEKLKLFGELADWCETATSSDVLQKMPSPRQLAKSHAEKRVLTNLEKSVGRLVLVITSNYPWHRTIGVLQRMYQPFFGLTIFCGPWFPEKYDDGTGKITYKFVHRSKIRRI